MLGHRVQRSAVGVPLLALAEEEPVGVLPIGEVGDDLTRLLMEAVAVKRAHHVGGVPEPEAVVRVGPRGDVGAVVEQQQEPTVGVDCLGEPAVGKVESHAPTAQRLPAPRHRGRAGHRRRQIGSPLDAPPGQTAAPRTARRRQRDRDLDGGAMRHREEECRLGQAGVALQRTR